MCLEGLRDPRCVKKCSGTVTHAQEFQSRQRRRPEVNQAGVGNNSRSS